MTSIPTPTPAVRYDTLQGAVVIDQLTITELSVVTESRRWSQGRRGPALTAEQMKDVDLSPFLRQALTVGVHAISTAGGIQEKFNLEGLVAEVGDRTADATARAATATTEAIAQATTALERASAEAKKVIADAGTSARQSFSKNVDGASKSLTDEINRLVGGDHPELLARLTPVLAKFGRELDDRAAKQTSELIDKVTRQFDPADPTSPMAKHNQELSRQQLSLRDALEKNHKELEAKVDELAGAVRSARAASDATAASITTLKGETYAQGVHRLMIDIAAGLGDEYCDTGSIPGSVSRSKKGDGVLAVDGGNVKVVLEMTDSKRTTWNGYLDEAERNRGALASLGLVRSADQLAGNSMQSYGARRIVLAFDPELDDPDLLRTVIQLLRLSAIAASSRQDDGEIETAQEKIAEAITLLSRIDEIKRLAGLVTANATKIDKESDTIRLFLDRLLGQAQRALNGVATLGAAAA